MVNKVERAIPAPYMNPLLAGILLGMVLLATFVVTGHGLGATGFTTRLTAWFGMYIAPVATNANDYLGGMFLGGSKRPWTALCGGVLAGFGARIAAGCTSGLGLSGAAVLSLAGFTFLGTFFAVGLLTSRFLKEEK